MTESDADTIADAIADATDTIADAIGRAILHDDGGTALDPDASADQLAIVARASIAERDAREHLHQAVTAAKAGGHSWAAIGDTLGLTRQAAQQRFGRGVPDVPDQNHRWLGPVTAFDEMAELRLAGQMGWRTVAAGLLRHLMVRTDTRWEHRRVVWKRPASHYTVDGWQVGARAFPWLYLVRDLGIPPIESPEGDEPEADVES